MSALRIISSLCKAAILSALLLTPIAAQAFQIAELPTACLPTRAVKDQKQACHCPPEKLCDNPGDLPEFLRSKCCDVPPQEAKCAKNGCSTGWIFTSAVGTDGSGASLETWYCTKKPDCSKLYKHVPAANTPEAQLYNSGKEREAKQVTIGGQNVWVCDATNICESGQLARVDVPSEGVLGSLLGGVGFSSICVSPLRCETPICQPLVAQDGVYRCNPGESCLQKDSKVLLADGKNKMIQDIVVGDKIKSQISTNTVLEIQINKSQNRDLYNINNGLLVVTESHPLLTQRGWSTAGRLGIAKTSNVKNWASTSLKVGDMLIGKDGAVKVTSLVAETVAESETYNLKLSGDNTFIANGVVVQGFESVSIGYNNEKKASK